MKATYKVAIKQEEKLLYLSYNDAHNHYFITKVEQFADKFTSLEHAIKCFQFYCERAYLHNKESVPDFVVIKQIHCPIVEAEKTNETVTDSVDPFFCGC